MADDLVKLKPCPFCTSHLIASSYVRDGRRIGCQTCGGGIVRFQPDAEQRAREAWNTRAEAAEATLHDTQERLKKAEQRAHDEEQTRRRCQAALRVARGYVLRNSDNCMAHTDLRTIDAALAVFPEAKDGGVRDNG
jgi:hypothetical protein